MTRGEMYDWASTVVAAACAGARHRPGAVARRAAAVRVELNPRALNAYGIGLSDVRAALAATNANRPKGLVEDASRVWWISPNDQARRAGRVSAAVLSYRNGAAVRLADVAEVVDSVQDVRNAGQAAAAGVLVIVNRERRHFSRTVQRVRDLMPWLTASIRRPPS